MPMLPSDIGSRRFEPLAQIWPTEVVVAKVAPPVLDTNPAPRRGAKLQPRILVCGHLRPLDGCYRPSVSSLSSMAHYTPIKNVVVGVICVEWLPEMQADGSTVQLRPRSGGMAQVTVMLDIAADARSAVKRTVSVNIIGGARYALGRALRKL